jgi:histo-blood group ABO system transferase
MSTIGNNLVENRWTCSDDFKHYYTADKTKLYDLHTRSPLALKSIGVCFVATGKYKQFLKPTMDSCIMNFAKPHPLTFFIFTDDATLFSEQSYQGFNVLVFPVERKGFPGDTLYRYHYMLKAEEALRSTTDYMFYMDVDYWVCNRDDTQNMISNVDGLIAVQHLHNLHQKQGNLRGTPETNPKSTACIHPHETMRYYFCGGFQGGSTNDYLQACKTISENINADDENGVMAVWHDESHWNRYLVNHPPRLVLSQSYVYPEECLASEEGENSKMLHQNRITPIMIALAKNHKEFQVAAV